MYLILFGRHNQIKLLLRNKVILIDIRPLYHLLQLGLINIIPKLFHCVLQHLQRNEACFLFVEHAEYLAHVATGILA